jgi:hypothetical protein
VADPFPSGLADVTLSYDAVGTGGVTPASGGTVTPATALTIPEAAGSYIDYTITRPAFAAGTGRGTFTASRPGYTPDSDAADIPAQEQDTVTPDLSVVPSVPTTTQQSFTVTSSNPSGGAGPATYVIIRGTTGTGSSIGAIADGTLNLVPSGEVITVNRAAFGTTTQASVEFYAELAGGGIARIQRTILNQVKTSFGPSIDGSSVLTPANDTLTWTSVGTLTLKVDGVSTSVPTSPYVVTRDGANHTWDFLATLDSQTFPWSVAIPRLDPPSGFTLTSVVGTATFVPDHLTVTFSQSGFPSGTQFNVSYTVDATTTGDGTSGGLDNTTSGHVFTVSAWPSSTPSGSITVDAVYNGQVIATKRRNGPFAL